MRNIVQMDMTGPIRLIATDLDGTLLNSQGEISDYTCSVLRKAINAGTILIPATGRAKRRLPQFLQETCSYGVTANGASIWNLRAGLCLQSWAIPISAMPDLLGCVDASGVFYVIFHGGEMVADRKFQPSLHRHVPEKQTHEINRTHIWTESLQRRILEDHIPVEKLCIPFSTPSQRQALCRELTRVTGISIVTSNGQNLEVGNSRVNKGVGLAWLSNFLSIPPEQVLAIGDHENDLDLLRYAGHSVAMGNAETEAKAVARYITEDNDHDGAALAIRRAVVDPRTCDIHT